MARSVVARASHGITPTLPWKRPTAHIFSSSCCRGTGSAAVLQRRNGSSVHEYHSRALSLRLPRRPAAAASVASYSSGRRQFTNSRSPLHQLSSSSSSSDPSPSSPFPSSGPLSVEFSRSYSSSSSSDSQQAYGSSPAPISDETYHRIADAYLDGLTNELDALVEAREDVDFEMSQGVLKLVLPPNGTYVLNKQPPNRQIWLSSPLSGPKRYDWVRRSGHNGNNGGGSDEGNADWVYLRDGSTLNGLLASELGIDVEGLSTENLDVE